GVSLELRDAEQLFDNLLAIGVGQRAAASEQFAGPPANSWVRMVGEGLLLVERQLREVDLPFSRRGQERPRPLRTAQEYAETGRAGAGGEARQPFEDQFARVGGFTQLERAQNA